MFQIRPALAIAPPVRALTAPMWLACLLTACGHSAPPPATGAPAIVPPSARQPSRFVQNKQDPAMATCHQSFKPASNDADLASDVAAMAKACADVTKMHAAGAPMSGERTEGAPPNVFPLDAQAGHCYRVYGVSAKTLQDLDLALVDSAGGLAGEDSTDDVTPVLLEDGAVCFKQADKAHIEVGAGAGGGKFAVQVWSD
jgi:hypothetical protein